MKKRFLATFLVLCLALGLLPGTAWAAVLPNVHGDIRSILPNSNDKDWDCWDGSISSSFESGTGTKTEPYEIASAAQLAYLAVSVNSENGYRDSYFVQTQDIDLCEIEWTPINGFSGNYDGNGHSIKGLKITSGSTIGLFGHINYGKISNITITNATLRGKKNIGCIAGGAGDGYPVIENCCVTNSSIIGETDIGGIVGSAWWSDIRNCVVDGQFTGSGPDSSVGGIVGYSVGGRGVFDSTNYATVEGSTNAGGIIGFAYQNVTMERSFNAGKINGNKYVGGICGRGDIGIRIINCYNTGRISGANGEAIGGIVGKSEHNFGAVQCCYNTGEIYGGDKTRTSPIAGELFAVSQVNCYYLSDERTLSSGGLTKAEMEREDSFVGYDFNVWIMSGLLRRPILRENREFIEGVIKSEFTDCAPNGIVCKFILEGEYDIGKGAWQIRDYYTNEVLYESSYKEEVVDWDTTDEDGNILIMRIKS